MDSLYVDLNDIPAYSDCFGEDYSLLQGCRNPEHQLTRVNKFCSVAPGTCNLLHVNFLMPSILRWHLEFGKFVHPWSSGLFIDVLLQMFRWSLLPPSSGQLKGKNILLCLP